MIIKDPVGLHLISVEKAVINYDAAAGGNIVNYNC
jgi:hypothetical protein